MTLRIDEAGSARLESEGSVTQTAKLTNLNIQNLNQIPSVHNGGAKDNQSSMI